MKLTKKALFLLVLFISLILVACGGGGGGGSSSSGSSGSTGTSGSSTSSGVLPSKMIAADPDGVSTDSSVYTNQATLTWDVVNGVSKAKISYNMVSSKAYSVQIVYTDSTGTVVQDVGTSGSMVVSPSETTTYELWVDGVKEDEVTVYVYDPLDVLSKVLIGENFMDGVTRRWADNTTITVYDETSYSRIQEVINTVKQMIQKANPTIDIVLTNDPVNNSIAITYQTLALNPNACGDTGERTVSSDILGVYGTSGFNIYINTDTINTAGCDPFDTYVHEMLHAMFIGHTSNIPGEQERGSIMLTSSGGNVNSPVVQMALNKLYGTFALCIVDVLGIGGCECSELYSGVNYDAYGNPVLTKVLVGEVCPKK